jgi:hypothetical protein
MKPDDVEELLASIEGRAFSDCADALAAIAEAERAVFEGWSSAAPGPERQRQLRGWLARLIAIAERVALYDCARSLQLSIGFPAGITVSVWFELASH